MAASTAVGMYLDVGVLWRELVSAFAMRLGSITEGCGAGVLCLCAQPKVLRVEATAITTKVVHGQIVGDGTAEELPGDAMHVLCLARSGELHPPIAPKTTPISGPFPAATFSHTMAGL
jgi:hypothetical protein